MRAQRLLAAALVAACTALAALAPAAHADRAFTQRFGENLRGDITLAANTSVTCAPSVADCAARQAGTAASNDNGGFLPAFVDVDGDVTTFASSQADLTVPAGATVRFAGLYWGGRPRLQPTGGTIAVTPAQFGEVKLRPPGAAAYQPITASQVDQVVFGTNGNENWQGFADVTSIVQAAGSGTYTVADLQIEGVRNTTNGSWGGWTLVVAYADATQPYRNLAVFDGLRPVQSGGSTVDIPLSGFETPPAPADVRTTIGFMTYEGDRGSTGDSARLIQGATQTVLTDAATPANNFFNSAIARGGVDVGDRLPAYPNQIGYDSKLLRTTNVLQNSTTSATIRVSTGGDGIAPGMISAATDLFTPRVDVVKTVRNVDRPGQPPAPGETLEYELQSSNAPTTAADPVDTAEALVLEDAIPANTTYVPGSLTVTAGPGAPSTPTDGAGDDAAEHDAGANRVRFRLGSGATAGTGGSLAPGAATTVRFRVRVGSGVADGTQIANDATVDVRGASSGIVEQERSNTVTSTVVVPADLALTKTGPAEVEPGAPVSWTLTLRNDGDATSGAATVVDDVPAAYTGVATTTPGCTVAGNQVTCAAGPLAPGASAPIAITANAPATTGTCATNTATVTAAGDGDASNDSASAETCTRAAQADVRIAKTVMTSTVRPGQPVGYTLTVSNHGPDAAQAVTVTDSATPQVPLTSATPSQGTCATPSSCALGTVAAGQVVTIAVAATATVPGTFGNTARVTTTTPDPDPSNDVDSANVVVQPEADLRLAMAVSATTVSAGDAFTYTIAVTNDGPSTAPDAVVTDALPAGVRLVSAQTTRGTCTDADPVVCRLGDLPAGASVTITLRATATVDGAPVNTAVAASAAHDPDPANNQDSTPLTAKPRADVTLTKTAASDVAALGGAVVYTLVARNDGPSAAPGVVVTDQLPDGLTLESVATTAGTCTGAPAVVCRVGTLGKGEHATITLTARAGKTGRAANTASVTSEVPDADADDNVPTAAVEITEHADLAIAKTASAASAERGDTVIYRVEVTNRGPGPAANVVMTDVVPAGMRVASVEPSAGTCSGTQTVTCALGDLPGGATAVIRIATVAEQPGSTRNVATVTSPTRDPQAASNRSETALTTSSADLAIRKTASQRKAVRLGDTLTYTITVTNSGAARARGVVVTDPTPAALDVTSAKASAGTCEVGRRAVVCRLGDVPGRTTRKVVVTARAARPGTVRNAASVAAQTPSDPVAANDVASASVRVQPRQAKVSLRKTASRDAARPGELVRYALTVRNRGGQTAHGVRVCDELPRGLAFVRHPGAKLRAGSACWTVKTLAPGKSRRFSVVARVLAGASGRLTNVARISGTNVVAGRAAAGLRRVGGADRAGGVTG